MSPVMVHYFWAVVLLHRHDPPAQGFVVQAELGHQAKIMEHPHSSLDKGISSTLW